MREQLQGIDTVEDAQLKLESATTARDNLARRERQLSEDIIAYSTELNNAATAKEDAEDAKLVAESATRKLAELRRKAAAAKLLLEELKKAREEKIAKYQAPFKEQFEALARYTFGLNQSFPLIKICAFRRVCGWVVAGEWIAFRRCTGANWPAHATNGGDASGAGGSAHHFG